MKNIKIRFVCEDLSGNIFFLYHTIDEFVNGLNLAKNGRIEKILAKDIFLGYDVNGKEIYENDIGILGEYTDSHGTFTCVIEYSEERACFWWIDTITNQWIIGRPSDAIYIGNIYENLEIHH